MRRYVIKSTKKIKSFLLLFAFINGTSNSILPASFRFSCLINTPLLNNNLYNKWKLHLDTIENNFKTINKEMYKEEINKIFHNVLKINSEYYE